MHAYFFLQRRPISGNTRCAFPSLSVTRRGEPEEPQPSARETEESRKRANRGRKGNIAVRRRGVPVIKSWSRRTRGNVLDQLRSVTEPPPWAKTGSLGCSCCCSLFCAVLYWMSSDTESYAGQSQSSHTSGGKTWSFAKMQGLSSRAHAFSVEALVGKPCKRMKVSEGHESGLAADTGSDTSIFTGEKDFFGFPRTYH